MNFVADESVELSITEQLRREGHHVWYIAELDPALSDEDVLELARKKQHL